MARYTFEGYSNQQTSEPINPTSRYTFEGYQAPEEESTGKSIARAAIQAPLGYAQKFTFPADLASLAAQGATREALGESEAMQDARALYPENNFPAPLTEEQKQGHLQDLSQNFPTQTNIERMVEEKTGLPLQPKNEIQKSLRLGGEAAGFRGGNIKEKIGAAIAAPAISQTAQAMGAPEEIANLGGLVGSGLSIPKISRTKLPTEKLPSGLEKPTALENKYSKYGKISKEVQEKTIKNLDEEAKKLSAKVLERERPLVKKINEGVDLDKEFQEGFTSLRQTAKKYNPELNVKPVSELMEKTRVDVLGLPNPSTQTRKIIKDIEAFEKNPPITLYDNLRNFRNLSEKQSEIYEKSFLHGKQKKYADFISDYKKSITKSMEETLPKDSEWMKSFKDLNKDYSEYLNTKKAQAILEPIFGKEITAAKLEKAATDIPFQKKLSFALGEKGAQDISQIAKDLKLARESISSIPLKQIDLLEKSLPYGYILTDLIPYGQLFKLPYYAKAAKSGAQHLLGLYLTKPKSRAAYSIVLKEFKNGNPQAFGKAVKALDATLTSED